MPAKIIAVDFDGCLCENKYPDIGIPIYATVFRLKQEKENGARLILWTCRAKERLTAALEWCAKLDIQFDAVNENLPDILAAYDGDSRKIYADEYWDDKAVRVPEETP